MYSAAFASKAPAASSSPVNNEPRIAYSSALSLSLSQRLGMCSASRCLFRSARSVCARQCGRSVLGPEAQASVSLLQAAGELCCSVLCCYRLTQRASRTMKERKRIPLLRLTRMLGTVCTTPYNALLLPARLQCSGGPEKENKERESWAKLNVYALRIRNRRTPAAI